MLVAKIVTIDGPSGAGKGTVAQHLARRFKLKHLDTGLLYRGLAACLQRENIASNELARILAAARTLDLEQFPSVYLRSEIFASAASQLAVIPEIREIFNTYQKAFPQHLPDTFQGAILDGRDIGTIIFPDAPCKIFLTADSDVRAQRRTQELPQDVPDRLHQIMAERDQRDMQRTHAPLRVPEGALEIDTTHLTLEEVCDIAEKHVEKCLF